MDVLSANALLSEPFRTNTGRLFNPNNHNDHTIWYNTIDQLKRINRMVKDVFWVK